MYGDSQNPGYVDSFLKEGFTPSDSSERPAFFLLSTIEHVTYVMEMVLRSWKWCSFIEHVKQEMVLRSCCLREDFSSQLDVGDEKNGRLMVEELFIAKTRRFLEECLCKIQKIGGENQLDISIRIMISANKHDFVVGNRGITNSLYLQRWCPMLRSRN